jgi:hypothetical protein
LNISHYLFPFFRIFLEFTTAEHVIIEILKKNMIGVRSCLDSFSVLVSTASGGAAPNRPPIPFQFGHPFRLKASVGKTREAVAFLKIAKPKVLPTDTEYVEKIDKNLAIQSDDAK